MAIIPLNQKFHTIENSVVTQERGSALVNSQKEIFVTQDIIDTVSAYVGLGGTQYVFVAANGTDLQNAAELQAAYVTAQGMSPSITNRITVIAAPGNYNFSTANFEMNTDYIDLVSLDGNKSIVFNGSNTIEITTNDVFVRGVDVGTLNFTIANSLNLLRVENCSGGDNSFGGGGGGTADGTFTDCSGGDFSFGGNSGTASGTFTNCTGGGRAFGGGGGTASGTFTDCTGGNDSFGGGGGGTASGTFTDCTGGDKSFGTGGTASGTFTNCSGGDKSFAGDGGTADGTFTDCSGTDFSFGGGGTADGVFTNCTGGFDSFGGGGGTASGTFTDCSGVNNSFGAFGTASGVFTNCTGGKSSFGSGGTASGVFNSCIGGDRAFGGGGGGTLNGFLYYCRLTSGTFVTVSVGGRTMYCIDGNNNINNQ
jgi:hypothetical protein